MKEKIEQAKENLVKYGVNELKQMLKLNSQVSSGNKPDLIERIADGIVRGRIPGCPKCSIGKLRYNPQTLIYNCPGSANDEGVYIKCGFKSTVIKREEWLTSQPHK